MNSSNLVDNFRRVLGRVPRHDFIGRTTEFERVVAQSSSANAGRGLLLLMEPAAGVSELLRQSYDEIFNRRSEVIPIYFAFTRHETTAVSAAIEFLNSFLQQYIAYSNNDATLSKSTLTLQDLVDLAPANDLGWINQLVQMYSRVRFSNDNKELVRFCLSAPQRVPPRAGRPFVMLDGSQLAEDLNGSVTLGTELLRVFSRSGSSFVLAGLRRQILNAAREAECNFERLDILRLQQLSTEDAHSLVDHVALRQQVPTSREVRDLLVQQFGGSPFFISSFLEAAREKNTALVSYLDCERLYADELLGGHLRHYFEDLLEEIVPSLDLRLALIRVLWEAVAGEQKSASVEAWRERLHLPAADFEGILHHLHIYELINWSGPTADATTGLQPWKDYLKTNYRLSILGEPRALVVADTISDALKRAPTTMARHYQELDQISLREVVNHFDCQRVPEVLFDYQRFAEKYKGASDFEVKAELEKEGEFKKLPQTVHVASYFSFDSENREVYDDDKCVVAHGFEEGIYNDANEVVWLVAYIESKLEVDAEVAAVWYERFESLTRSLAIGRHQVWLIATEGFSTEACSLLQSQSVATSSKRQLEVLIGQLGDVQIAPADLNNAEEFLIVVPMGEENELLAANTVEHIARRLKFQPAEINQLKTAVVEACINASEHSHSPERKIYQRFRVESDKLVVTISSRGILPTNVGSGNTGSRTIVSNDVGDERRGWGLKLIRSLMDEVEFERVDEGTSLRMTKYVRNTVD